MTETPLTRKPFVPAPRGLWLSALAWGQLSGWGLIFLPYIITLVIRHGPGFLTSKETDWTYNASLLLLLPVIQGAVAGWRMGAAIRRMDTGFGLICLLLLIDILIGTVLREGVICLIMASPLLLGFIAIGYALGRYVAKWGGGKTLPVSLAPLVLLAVVAETSGPVPNSQSVVVDEVTVAAPADYVWRYVVAYPDNPNPPDYWLWQIGLPAPTHSVAAVAAVGARRDCKFQGDKAFEEVITELEPNKKLTFAITKQPQHPEIIGHITVDKGQIELRANADGTTTLIATSWYRLHVRPAAYFNLWAADVTRHIHFRVLGYMKTLAERDYSADKARQGA